MSKAYALTRTNVAEIVLPTSAKVHVKAKTNSKNTQRIALKDKSGDVDLLFSGTGEGNSIIGDATFTGDSNSVLNATFEYSEGSGVFKPAKLNTGGPYEIGQYNLMIVVAENGDDSDYNDSILEFSWYTPKD
ncbi:fucose-binding lectin II [Stigmatella sp. ncwal1]|uniref:Fucose-binding lectin II n=1 Tax=Stigmatella ashevillensis TaxID=2995309 RepID=A0ABT5DDU2_9BACT|nr:fucose-binding lectin II [Stigmatella ashevillena]MDC0711850.1 fucose-binding lectin II [Stigmatella ashevillena]